MEVPSYIQSPVSHPTARHPDHQPPYLTPCTAFPESPLRRLVDQLIECGIHIVSELYFGYGPHALRRAADCEPNDSLLGQGRVEDALRAKGCGQVAGAPEYAAKGDIFAEDERCGRGLKGMREGSVDGLEEVEARGGTVYGEFRAGRIQGGG